MTRTIYVYEVILRLTERATGKTSQVVRTEHAYSPSDAYMQAVLNADGQLAVPGTHDFRAIAIGPPSAAIREVELQLAEEIRERVSVLHGRLATDAVGKVGKAKATVSRKI